jgi:glycosyltransferase involved in cell wall biosynthesis
MPHIPEITVIIPSNQNHHALLLIVHAICGQTVKPYEIVIVDSSVEGGIYPVEVGELCAFNGIKLIYEHRERALPGDARNVGLIVAKGEFIALIDVKTIPRPHWLETTLKLLSDQGAVGVLGATCFSAQTRFERLVRDGFYGVLPRRTLPGSIFRREVFEKTGRFIDWARAGEDTEWLLRLEVLKIPIVYSSIALVDYVGLIGLDPKQMLRKWYRNYEAARELPHFISQKLILWMVIYPFIVLIAFNWNYIIAEWRMDSPMYIGHVTKIAALLPLLAYLIVRGFILPLQRGVRIWQLLPARFLGIVSVCFMADFVKVLVFSMPKREHDVTTMGNTNLMS